MTATFESAITARVDDMIDTCTRCGKCVEACPVTAQGGVTAEPRDVIEGVIDILRLGEGSDSARKWASACVQSGECIQACPENINPRFLLAMARVTMSKKVNDSPAVRKKGV